MNTISLSKQTKKARKEYYAGKRGSWNGVNPVTRRAKNEKLYDRNRYRKTARREMTDLPRRADFFMQ